MAHPDGIPHPVDPRERDPLLGALPSLTTLPRSLPKRCYRGGEMSGMTIAMPSFSAAKKTRVTAFIAKLVSSYVNPDS